MSSYYSAEVIKGKLKMKSIPIEIELYDIGRTTHSAVPGMYEFIAEHAGEYVQDKGLAQKLAEEARLRETPGHSIPQQYFSEMCKIWVQAHQEGVFVIHPEQIIYSDVVPRFMKVHEAGRRVGVLTSSSHAFTELLFHVPIGERNLADFVDEYYLGEEIGDKDSPETFSGLWERTKGGIYAVFDDKLSVCRAAVQGIQQAGGTARVYLVDRKKKNPVPDEKIVRIISFAEVETCHGYD